MPESIPSTIAHYTITREVGRGGMGVVYLATDTRLGREVAIKSLPVELASDPARLERFEREARTLAQLNHPNVAGIYGVEEHEGAKYLVLEYVEGETLADRLDRGALSVEDAVECAMHVASGVEAAHDSGVIHRDIKPANIKVLPDGSAKVLDFGLAREDESQSSSAGGLDSPTMTTPVPQHSPTIAGAILGTAAYMSPEQARGRKVDTRTDIWSFGVMLYEMLTGVGPFQGETATDSIGAVLHKDPDLSRLPAGIPNGVRTLIRRCLERDTSLRLQSIGDARVELHEAWRRLEAGETDDAMVAEPTPGARWVWPVVAIVAVLALIGSVVLRTPTPPVVVGGPAVPVITNVEQLTDLVGVESSPALSPDGKTLLFVAEDGGDADIFLMRVGGANPINLTPNSDADDLDPAFSPDGERIAFASGREGGGIFVMGATGENPRRMSDAGFDPAWSPDGTKLAYTSTRVVTATSRIEIGTLWVLDLETGESRRLDTSDPSDTSAMSGDAVEPAWSPDGRRIAFWAVSGGQRDLFTIAAEGGDRVTLMDDTPTDWNPVWSADGRSIRFLSDRSGRGSLWSIPVDADGRAAGAPTALMPGPSMVMEFAASADGDRLAFIEQQLRGTVDRIGFDPETERFVAEWENVLTSSSMVFQSDVSADGEWIALTTGAPKEDIVVMRSDGSQRRRLMDDYHKDRGPRWSAGTESLIFYSNREGEYKVFRIDRDGSDLRVILESDAGGLTTPSLSPDGRYLTVSTMDRGQLYRLGEDGTYTRADDLEQDIDLGLGLESWSPSGTRLLGIARTAVGQFAIGARRFGESEYKLFTSPDGRFVGRSDRALPDWIDDDRVIGWDPSRESLYIGDAETGTVRWIESSEGLEGTLHVVNNGTELFLVSNNRDADVWMVEFDSGESN